MEVREWSLILFTLLQQLAVGAFVVIGIVHFWASRKTNPETADRLANYSLLALGPLLVLAMLASLLHLGNPLSAPRAVTNFASSWLSREILFSVLFFLVGGVFALMQWRGIGSRTLRNVLAVIAAVLGVVVVYSMSQIYALEAQPAWNSWYTVLSFFVTAFLLGVLGVGAAYGASYGYLRRADPDCVETQCALLRDVLKGLAIAAVVLVGIEFVAAPLYVASLASGTEPARQSAQLLVADYGVVFGLRLVLAFIGAGLLAFLIYRAALLRKPEALLINLTYTAFAVVLVSEVLGRFLFYATHIKLGI